MKLCFRVYIKDDQEAIDNIQDTEGDEHVLPNNGEQYDQDEDMLYYWMSFNCGIASVYIFDPGFFRNYFLFKKCVITSGNVSD